MQADSSGAGVMLRAVKELASEDIPATRKLTLQSERREAFHAFRLRLSPASNELRRLAITIENDTPTLEFTASGMPDVTSALENWIKGVEDFCLFPQGKKSELGTKDTKSGDLWFWVTMLP